MLCGDAARVLCFSGCARVAEVTRFVPRWRWSAAFRRAIGIRYAALFSLRDAALRAPREMFARYV